jgi:hypothetical protein
VSTVLLHIAAEAGERGAEVLGDTLPSRARLTVSGILRGVERG